ncbi:MalY/PatB family protein [Allobacillus sp. GCM10007491]|uniref:cysteine-S-conjugate beta-lyase n=1 Tax=Allobacillus saliphilus TaxID=2912308 RepID=A0A941CTL5_9BACI|nr:MalY/PatB family protein [Allobacillus saliphilus]MBR7553602.1 pyridoxal phosphate-dependent aminotransferase [Allobacillus saliphilus]
MKEIFEQGINRENTNSAKWDAREKFFGTSDVLPMWVADMDFAAPPTLKDALIKRAEHNAYGYTIQNDELLHSIENWVQGRHQTNIDTDLLSFSPGVIPGLHAVIQAFTEENDQIVIQPPVYPPFFSVIETHNRTIVENPLVLGDNGYEMNFVELEELFKAGAKALLLCSPHNPVGRVWTEEEMKKVTNLCVKYDVLLFSDEIHADIVFSKSEHFPAIRVNEKVKELTFTLMAPSKTFNIAGLQGSFILSPNEEQKEKLDKQLQKQGIGMLNTFAYTAMQTVYETGDEWLEELNKTLENNRDLVKNMFEESGLPIRTVSSEGTYLVWIDFRETDTPHDELKKILIEEAKVGLNDGTTFGKQGEQFMRMNIAAPHSTVEDGVNRIIEAFSE